MYRVEVSEVIRELAGAEYAVAVKASIRPPIDLSQEAVSRFIENGNLLDDSVPRDVVSSGLGSPVLLGSTKDETVIHAYIDAVKLDTGATTDRYRNLIAKRTISLLNLLGVEAELA